MGSLDTSCVCHDQAPDALFSSIVCRSWEVLLGDQVKDDQLQVLGIITSSGVYVGLKLPNDTMVSDVR